jgi:CubicO group peptidase (beta-lactamase class C family)
LRPASVRLAGAIVALLAATVVRAQEPYPGLDAYITKAVQTWKTPAISVAIVRNDSVIYTKGFGTLGGGGRGGRGGGE